jgi:hypothetical protein
MIAALGGGMAAHVRQREALIGVLFYQLPEGFDRESGLF